MTMPEPTISPPSRADAERASTVDEWLAVGRRRFLEAKERGAPVDDDGLGPREVHWLLGHVLGWTEAQVRARGERPVPAADAERFRALLDRRASGEPMAYVLGYREFYGRRFRVDPRVLIPRPETEHLVEAAIERLRGTSAPRILDVGTGSGCIAVTLACELDGARVTATDLSPGALEPARANARDLGASDRVCFVVADVAAPLVLDAFDLVVSNPPYVARDAIAEMSPDVPAFEPHLALFAEDHGLRVIHRILDAAIGLRPGVEVLMEIGYDQGVAVEEAVRRRPHLRWIEVIHDYAGHPRVAVCRRSEGS